MAKRTATTDVPLTPKQAIFVQEYLREFSPKKAQEAAGFSGKNYCYKLLQKHEIQQAIKRQTANRNIQTGIDTAYVVDNLVHLHTKAESEGDYSTAARTLELLGRHVGAFEKDNTQKNQRVNVLLNLTGDNKPTMLPMPNNQKSDEATIDQLDTCISVV